MLINKRWIFVLDSDYLGRSKLENDPDGWDKQRVSIKRSKSFFGMFRTFVSTLRFSGDGREYVRNVYEVKGTEHIINIGIFEYNQTTKRYELYYSGVIDLSTYSIEEDLFVDVDINDNDFARKVKSRDDTKVTFSRTKSIEGLQLPANNSVQVLLHEREIKLTGVYGLAATNTTLDRSIGPAGTAGMTVPMTLISGNIDNLVSNPFGDLDTTSSLFWTKAAVQSSFIINIKINGTVHSGSDATGTRFVTFRKYTNDALTTFVDTDIILIPNANFGVTQAFSFDGQVPSSVFDSIQPNEQIALILRANVVDFFKATFDEIEMDISLDQLFESTNAQGFLMHEAFDRITQVITDTENSFKSDFLGRTDIGYEANGKGAFQTVHSGSQIRAIPDVNPSESLMSLFKSLNAQTNLALGIEFNEVGKPILRLEEKKHWFSGDVILTVNEVSEFAKEFAREFVYNEIEVGYTKSEIEDINGREEYNNKFSFDTKIGSFKNKLDLTSTLRMDGYGIEKVRQFQFSTNPNEDLKEDNDNFSVIVLQNGTDSSGNPKYKSAKDEGYDLVENIFSPESAYNLDRTPGRNFRANGGIIRPGLEKYLDDEITFGFAEQKANLKSQKTGEIAITENENIDVKTLDTGFWIPEIYRWKSVLTRDRFKTIERKSNGIIKFSTASKDKTTKYNYMWILEVNSESEDELAEWIGLRVNTSSPQVTLVDPEGDDPNVPIPPIDPSPLLGVFEGAFPFVFVDGGETFNKILEDGSKKLTEDGNNKILEDG